MLDLDVILHNFTNTMASTRVIHVYHQGQSMSKFIHCKNLFPGHNLSGVTWIEMILHLIVAKHAS